MLVERTSQAAHLPDIDDEALPKAGGGVVREASYLVPLRLECDWFIEVPVYTDRLPSIGHGFLMLVKSCQEEPKLILQLSLRVVLGAFRIQLLALE